VTDVGVEFFIGGSFAPELVDAFARNAPVDKCLGGDIVFEANDGVWRLDRC
jgi:hypothetical protein